MNEAEPPESGAVASVVAPCLKVIISPLGGAPPAEVTVAVNVTSCPTKEGLGEETSMVVVANFATTDWLSAEEVLLRLLLSPAYCAVMERVPAVAKDVVKLPWLPLRGAVPSVVAPFLKTTEPVATPPNWLETVAVNVID